MEGHLFAYNEYANEQNTKGLLYLKFRCTWGLEVICKRDITVFLQNLFPFSTCMKIIMLLMIEKCSNLIENLECSLHAQPHVSPEGSSITSHAPWPNAAKRQVHFIFYIFFGILCI